MPKGAAAGGAAAGVGGGGGGASAGLGGTGGGGGNLAAVSGRDGVAVKPLVKHVLSKELQLYFEKVCAAVLDETNDAYRTSALASLREDPGLHQLVPYFVQFISEKVTHGLKDLFVLTQTIHMTESLIENKSLYIDPYIPSLVPPVLTCLIGSRLGSATPPSSAHEHFALRDLAASLIGRIAKKYAHSSHTLRPRLARTLLRCFLDPGKPLSTHYGAVIGLRAIADGPDVVRELVVPNLSTYDLLLREAIAAGEEEGGAKKVEAEKVADTLLAVLLTLKDDALSPSPPRQAGGGDDGMAEDMPAEMQSRLIAKLGEVVGSRVIAREDVRLAQILLDDKAI
ncbi:hypothetical protein KEM52_006383 [Ascosphaera acerosa]|nr:hypothetical protein KEM52_006383 [Ascosphaera acerosa]